MNLYMIVKNLSAAAPEINDAVAEAEGAGWIEMIKQMIADANPMRFVESLRYMGAGMLGIFLVMGILILGTAILNKVTNLKPKKKD